MPFTTSSSKWALVRSDLRRFWPLLFGYAVLWLCAMPVALWSHRDYARTLDHVRVLCDIVNSYFSNGGIVAAAIVPACFTVLLTMALFSYLMNSRSVGLMHSLPITRGAQFGVHFAVGVGMFTAVHVVTALISLPVQAALGAVDLQGTLEWLAVAEVSGLLFFSLSTLCAMVTGWLLAIPVIYAGVNFPVRRLLPAVFRHHPDLLLGLRGLRLARLAGLADPHCPPALAGHGQQGGAVRP